MGILVFVLMAQLMPINRVYAVLGVGDLVIVSLDTSPTSINRTINSIRDDLKNYVLDHLATVLAKQILHQMTTSVINWINSGFQGSPAFITNPEGFFLDAADQVTGAFLSQGGPLAQLCSPFGVDIRIALALQQSSRISKRYTCTLGRIINNFENLPGSISVNGRSVDGFMGGDFRQGGWPAFISMTTEPQNNIYGAYLQAQGDLQAQILGNKAKIDLDLNRGKGFLSWQNCKELGTIDPYDDAELAEAELLTQGDAGVTTKANSDGTITYRSCSTDTPGSVISGVLEKQLNVPATELELADDINAVINALMSQLVTQMLGGGLRSLSGGSGGGPSYTQQIYRDATSQNNLRNQDTQARLKSSLSGLIGSLQSYKETYDRAVGILTDSRNRLGTARACLAALDTLSISPVQSNYLRAQMSNIDSAIRTRLDPILAQLTIKQAEANRKLEQLDEAELSTPNTSADIRAQAENYSAIIENAVSVSATGNSNAQQDLQNADAEAQRFNYEANRYQQDCSTFPYSVTSSNPAPYYY